ncbi:unnamed protein product [Vitrella brassicaformis CCMP3155]|uniref:C3H1-type domain-containing protein n=3 Tax=Vitrella brassicaformis TaxID=1169539 RepID=A0A0G4EMH0_VITBC|nr:unnamed protein product [Vitrella brassicaformis CCMP3155]|eukprot:CEL98369.1 unnamed protein product [Vitrella brassicaformis CCMP3155]
MNSDVLQQQQQQQQQQECNKTTAMQCYKTKLCRFHLESRCLRGENCTFAHNAVELRAPPDLSRTKICGLWAKGRCNDPSCKFAHGHQELKSPAACYKTSLCFLWQKGMCNAGERCRYAHGVEELRTIKLADMVQSGQLREEDLQQLTPSYYDLSQHSPPTAIHTPPPLPPATRTFQQPSPSPSPPYELSPPMHGHTFAGSSPGRRERHSTTTTPSLNPDALPYHSVHQHQQQQQQSAAHERMAIGMVGLGMGPSPSPPPPALAAHQDPTPPPSAVSMSADVLKLVDGSGGTCTPPRAPASKASSPMSPPSTRLPSVDAAVASQLSHHPHAYVGGAGGAPSMPTLNEEGLFQERGDRGDRGGRSSTGDQPAPNGRYSFFEQTVEEARAATDRYSDLGQLQQLGAAACGSFGKRPAMGLSSTMAKALGHLRGPDLDLASFNNNGLADGDGRESDGNKSVSEDELRRLRGVSGDGVAGASSKGSLGGHEQLEDMAASCGGKVFPPKSFPNANNGSSTCESLLGSMSSNTSNPGNGSSLTDFLSRHGSGDTSTIPPPPYSTLTSPHSPSIWGGTPSQKPGGRLPAPLSPLLPYPLDANTAKWGPIGPAPHAHPGQERQRSPHDGTDEAGWAHHYGSSAFDADDLELELHPPLTPFEDEGSVTMFRSPRVHGVHGIGAGGRVGGLGGGGGASPPWEPIRDL